MLEEMAKRIRLAVIEMSHRAETPHLGSSLSVVDILCALGDKIKSDKVILSKGHAVTALYALLAELGQINKTELLHFNENGSRLPEQPSPHCVPGVEWATGSLGHGLSVGVGFSLAARIKKEKYKTYVVMSDGECNEGSVWEACMFASAQGLSNLAVIVDYNKWQATGRSNEVMCLSPLEDKFQSFGWDAISVNGHDIQSLRAEINKDRDKPLAIIANTVKGKGVSFMEDDNNWHYRIPTKDEVAKAKVELGL